MPRRQIAGPKSKTQSRQRYFLGESTATEASDAESFQSAELEPNHTDYGFNYTSNDSPRTSRRTQTKQPSAAREVAQKETRESRRSNPIVRNTRSSPRAPPLVTNKKKPRKQTNPLQRERLLWKNIRELQKRTDNLTPKAPFGRVIREILMQQSSYATKITVAALEALQTSSEIYLTNLLSDAYVCTLHRGRVTLAVHDVRLVRFLRGPTDSANK